MDDTGLAVLQRRGAKYRYAQTPAKKTTDGESEPPSSHREQSFTIPTSLISEDAARQALLEYAKKKRFSSSRPVQEMVFKRLRPFKAFRYRLDTFTENRTCKRLTVLHNGNEVDGAGNGPLPDPWDIQKRPPHLFRDSEYHMPLPHTSSVMKCFQCCGRGSKGCRICCGSRRTRCMFCFGLGWFINLRCISCGGSGCFGCSGCSGTGIQPCTTCCGQGKFFTFIKLSIKWKNHNDEFLTGCQTDFPTECFDEVTGKIVFSDEQRMVSPVTNFPEPSINKASKKMISQHRSEFAACRILRQRHTIEWLPLTKVDYIWKGAEYHYYVYGKENRAYAKDYPRKYRAIKRNDG